MKYIVFLGDGMAGLPLEELNNKTILQAAYTPNMDFLAKNGISGMIKTVPNKMHPASDIANLSVLGYDPRDCYTGRSPLEAISMGIDMGPGDVAYRCNLVSISEGEKLEDAIMIDYSSGEISTEEATELIVSCAKAFQIQSDIVWELHTGASYRHCLMLRDGETGSLCTPPHDITGRCIKEFLPQGENSALFLSMMEQSRKILENHPINIKRKKEGLKPGNCCWFWGEGTKPTLTPFSDKYGIKGGVISAVDLIKGIGICAGLKSVDVEGATGTLDTNYSGKANAALKMLEEVDFVYLHVEAPDECGHHKDIEGKIKAIESIDREIIGPILKVLEERQVDYRALLLPDHPTPIEIGTHSSDPVPFVLYRPRDALTASAYAYSEVHCAKTGIFVQNGFDIMDMLIKHDKNDIRALLK